MKNDHLPAFGHSWQADALTKANHRLPIQKKKNQDQESQEHSTAVPTGTQMSL
jgi:hypothetical protein